MVPELQSNPSGMNHESLPENGAGRPPLLKALVAGNDPLIAPGFAGNGDSSASELHAWLLENFAGARITPAVVDEIMDGLAEQGALRNSGRLQRPDESKWRTLAARLLKVVQYVKNHPNPTAIYAALHVWDLPDFDDLNMHLNQPEFARTIIVSYEVARGANGRPARTPVYLTKAAVNNAVLDAQKHFQLPPRKDQRGAAARATMAATRCTQLSPSEAMNPTTNEASQ